MLYLETLDTEIHHQEKDKIIQTSDDRIEIKANQKEE